MFCITQHWLKTENVHFVVSFERREGANMSMVQDPGSTLKSTVNGATRFVHVVHDRMELLCHID